MPIPIRSDFDARQLRVFARKTKDGPQARRLLALAAIYDGATRTEAARIGGVTLQIVRDWVVKFNSHGPDGLIDRKAPGQSSKLNDEHRAAIANRSRRFTASCVGGLSIPVNGYSRSSARHRQADPEPGTARHRVSQTFCSPAPSCADGRGIRGY